MNSASFVAVGDMLLTRDLHYRFHHGGIDAVVHQSIRNLLRRGNATLANVEAVITDCDRPNPKGEHKPYYFRMTRDLASLLADLGIAVVTTANNHTLDFGIEGLFDHKEYLLGKRILAPGSGNNLDEALKPVFLNVGDAVIGVISVSCVRPRQPCASATTPGIARVDKPEELCGFLSGAIQEARRHANLVVLSPHWIENWAATPPEHVREVARQLIDRGVDAIVGHSSHLLHSVEVYQGRPIIYDMGTFLSDRISGHRDIVHSAVFSLRVQDGRFSSVDATPVTLGPCFVGPPTQASVEYVRKVLQRDLGREVQVEEGLFRIDLRPSWEPHNPLRPESVDQAGQFCWDRFGPQNDRSQSLLTSKEGDWACSFENGIMISSVASPRAAHSSSGFLVEVGLENTRPMDGNWIVEILIRDRASRREYREHHPFAQGTQLPCQWKLRGTAKDICAVRPQVRLKPGCYDLFWGLYDSDADYRLKTIQGLDHFYLGPLYVLKDKVPATCAGIDWDGTLPLSVENRMLHDCLYSTEERVMLNIRERLLGFVVSWGELLAAFETKHQIPHQGLLFIGVYDRQGKVLQRGCARKELSSTIVHNIRQLRASGVLKEFDLESTDTGVFIEIVQRAEPLPLGERVVHNLPIRGCSFDSNGKTLRVLPSVAQRHGLHTVRDKIRFICSTNRLDEATVAERIQHAVTPARLLSSTIIAHRTGELRVLEDEPFQL